MSPIYEAIGRAVVWFVRVRYGRQIRIAIGVGAAVALIGAFLAARRNVEEG